jgi:hypothetical protein
MLSDPLSLGAEHAIAQLDELTAQAGTVAK